MRMKKSKKNTSTSIPCNTRKFNNLYPHNVSALKNFSEARNTNPFPSLPSFPQYIEIHIQVPKKGKKKGGGGKE